MITVPVRPVLSPRLFSGAHVTRLRYSSFVPQCIDSRRWSAFSAYLRADLTMNISFSSPSHYPACIPSSRRVWRPSPRAGDCSSDWHLPPRHLLRASDTSAAAVLGPAAPATWRRRTAAETVIHAAAARRRNSSVPGGRARAGGAIPGGRSAGGGAERPVTRRRPPGFECVCLRAAPDGDDSPWRRAGAAGRSSGWRRR